MKKDLLNFRGVTSIFYNRGILFVFLFFISSSLLAQEEGSHQIAPSIYSNLLFVALLLIILGLLVLIITLAEVVKSASRYRMEQEKQKKIMTDWKLKTVIALFIISGYSTSVTAQTLSIGTTDTYWGLDTTTFYIMLGIIAFEILVAIKLYTISLQLLGVEERRTKAALEKEKIVLTQKQPSLIDKLNASVAIEKEADILLDHDYDGIRELDNDLPPWWRYGFYLTIIVAVVYLFNYHV
ncbi:MAG TPA: cbb3-type cytochrome c oxidase N-terminal domain-containing protein, partial [Bacteroidia bacterium]|nr:cbb3-type cytochrome c oxidase N-terminal domain-containing protein [Bacteroidia bacterium]